MWSDFRKNEWFSGSKDVVEAMKQKQWETAGEDVAAAKKKKKRENKRQTELEQKRGIDGHGCVQRWKARWGEKRGRRHKNITDSVSRPGLGKDIGIHCQEMAGFHLGESLVFAAPYFRYN